MHLSVGTKLGPYEIVGLVGAGGMGEVYRARDPRLARDVAIKVLPSAVAGDRDRLRRFEQEARAAAALNHPNILAIHDVGTHDGHPFVVAELLEGETVRTRIARGPMPPPEALAFARQMGQGLVAAHAKGIVHRDLKPENLFVTSDGRLKILDFGLAKLAGQELTDATSAATATEAGVIVGTVGYMAPEQIRAEPVDHRADLFAAGAILYEMLSGERAFRGKTAAETLSAILTREPAPLQSAAADFSQALEAVVRRSLEKAPERRFQSAIDLISALDTAASQPATVHNLPASVRTRTSWTVVIGAALIVVTVALAGWWATRGRGRADAGAADEVRRVIAVLPFKNLSADAAQNYFSAGMTEEIRGQLSKMSALHLLGASAVNRYGPGDARRMTEELGAGSIVEGSVRADAQRVRIAVQLVDARTGQTRWSEQYDRDLRDVFAVQSDVALRIADALNATLSADERQRVEKAPTSNPAAYQLYLKSSTLKLFDREENHQAIELLQQATTLDPGFAMAQANTAYRMMFLGAFQDPTYSVRALETARQALRTDPTLAYGHFALATIYAQQGKVADARVAFLRALQLDPNNSGSMMNLSILESDLGHYDESLLWAARAFRLVPNVSDTYYHVGVPLVVLGDDRSAEHWLREAERRFPNSGRITVLLSMLEWLGGRQQPALARARNLTAANPHSAEDRILSTELAYLTAAPDSEQLAESLSRTSPEISGNNWWLVPESARTRYAYLLAARGERSQSTTLADQAMASAQKALESGNQSPRVPMEIGAIHALRHDTDAAVQWVQRAYDAGWRDYRTLARDPVFEVLRADARFQALLKKMESDVAEMRRRVNLQETIPVPPAPQPRALEKAK